MWESGWVGFMHLNRQIQNEPTLNEIHQESHAYYFFSRTLYDQIRLPPITRCPIFVRTEKCKKCAIIIWEERSQILKKSIKKFV